MHNIHITLEGKVIDLLSLSDEEFAFYNECLEAYRKNMDHGDYLRMVQNPNNAWMKGSRFITKEIYYSPLGQAVWDLRYRLAIRQGDMGADEKTKYLDVEPAQEDQFVTLSEAAKMKGVSQPAILAAIRRGDLAAHKENGRWKVSVRSLELYQPNPVRQAAPSKRNRG